MAIIILIGIVFPRPDLSDPELPKYAIKRMNKAIKRSWPDKKVSKIPLEIGAKKKEEFSFKIEDYHLYELKAGEGEKLGYLCLSQAHGKFDEFDYMVILSPEMSVLKVRVLVYRENYGGEVSSRRWLNQFEGKSNGEKMELKEDIQAISGATISVRSITRSLKKLTKDMMELKEKEVLNINHE